MSTTRTNQNNFTISRGTILSNAFTATVTRTTSTCNLTVNIRTPGGGINATGRYMVSPPGGGGACVQNPPGINITPSSQSGSAGSSLSYVVRVENKDNGTDCTARFFSLTSSCSSSDWTCNLLQSNLSIAPGSANTTTINVTSPITVSQGTYQFIVTASSGSSTNSSIGTYIVGTGCIGNIILSLIPSALGSGDSFVPSASGLSNCDNKKVEFRKDSCTGDKTGECLIINGNCAGAITTSPLSNGTYTYFACIDKNLDGEFIGDGENNSKILSVGAVCSHANPTLSINPTEVKVGAAETYTFSITVGNEDPQNCGQSVFNLYVNCPDDWKCTLEKKSLTIASKGSLSTTVSIKSSLTATGKTTIYLTVENSADSRYNLTKNIDFNVDKKCGGANVKITDVSFYGNGANITIENNGTSELTINSIVMTDKSGKTYTPTGLPIVDFKSGEKEIISFTNIPSCANFSKVNISTDCSKAFYVFDQKARCLTEAPKSIVKIKSVDYNDVTRIELRNDGSGSVDSNSIKMLIDGTEVICKNTFKLSSKSTAVCQIDNLVCAEETAKLELIEPTKDEMIFECKKPINITAVKFCKDINCNQVLDSLSVGEKFYLNVKTTPVSDIKATIIYSDDTTKSIKVSQQFILEKEGTCVIELEATKEGYRNTTLREEINVEPKTGGGSVIKITLIFLFIIIVAAFVYYRLKRTKKRQNFEQLYEKYRKANYGELYKKYGKKKRVQRRF
jgi:hypothetical protein